MAQELSISGDKAVKITYSVVAASLFFVAGFAAWMTTMEAKASANAQAIDKVEDSSKHIEEVLISIDRRLYVIEQLIKASSHKRGDE
jgi:hypothetical protein